MARIRTIKPEFWTSEQIVECSRDARLLFIGIWNFADDAGRMVDSPRQMKMKILPGDDLSIEDVQRLLDELSTNGLIERYIVDGKEYLQVTGWHHQKIDRPRQSDIPEPSQGTRRTIDEHSTPEGRGKEGSGVEGRGEKDHPSDDPKKRPQAKARTKRQNAAPMPEGFPDDEAKQKAVEYWRSKGMGDRFDVELEADAFVAHHQRQQSTYRDWNGAWRTWYVNAVKFAREKYSGDQRDGRRTNGAADHSDKTYDPDDGTPCAAGAVPHGTGTDGRPCLRVGYMERKDGSGPIWLQEWQAKAALEKGQIDREAFDRALEEAQR